MPSKCSSKEIVGPISFLTANCRRLLHPKAEPESEEAYMDLKQYELI